MSSALRRFRAHAGRVAFPAGGLLVIVLALVCSACSHSESSVESTRGADTTIAAPDSALDQVARESGMVRFTGDLDSMVARGRIRVLVPYSQTFFFYDGAQPRGLAYEFGEKIGEHVRRQYGERAKLLSMLYLPVPRDQLIPRLLAGQGDLIIAGMTETESRKRVVDIMTTPEWTVSEVIVTGPGAPTLRSLEDLSGQEVFVRRSTTHYESLMELNRRLRAAGRPEVRVALAPEELEMEDILELVRARIHPITISDDYMARFWADVLDSLVVREDLVLRAHGKPGPVVRKDNPALAAAIREFQKTDGLGRAFGNVVRRRYLKENRWVRDPASAASRQRLLSVLPLFKKYANEYEFDTLLLLAQGFQESRLDPTLRSRAGAVGVMQIKPSTAAGHPIRISGVEASTERNIQAGVRYLRYMADEYFDEPGMTPLNRQLFAIAAYNCGPRRVQDMRRRARERGLDPDVWFHNVELVSARELGRENVEYVRNILKYWVAYRLAADRNPELAAALTQG